MWLADGDAGFLEDLANRGKSQCAGAVCAFALFHLAKKAGLHGGLKFCGSGDVAVGPVDTSAGKHIHAGQEDMPVMAPSHQDARLVFAAIEHDDGGGILRALVLPALFALRIGQPFRKVGHQAVSSASSPKPCILSAHCRPINAALTGGRSVNARIVASGSHSAMCTQTGG